ncbi:RHS repeat-associated protein [Kribbella sp. VKM Ac-2527]|uniref:RHS repeat-associated protein n=1 Tax=Kribbella caucasensis TaxID=2512215 RepID=A0A4R6K5J3_9ACTN|nr:RHS repeat-associated core domain-containing protein [Kribbella sp. VKM Ac-2527]TDO44613.1 RHS repeat-associated protein [Kribbella sp. VKM Ac-2527]
MFVLDRSQRARLQKFPRFTAAVVSLALLIAGIEANHTDPAEAAVPSADPKPAEPKVVSRPDVLSASVTARSQGSRVEVESMRTETSTTWSNPDGTMTTDAHAAPIRFKTASGGWQDIDLTLQKGIDGSVAPRGHQRGLQLGKRNAATGQVFASSDTGAGQRVEWISPWKLPEPTLDGTKATYADVQPGVDLVLDARRNGFENDFILKHRPAAAPVWRIPLRTKGLTPRQLKDGTIEFVDAKNVVRSRIPIGFMWDAAIDGVTGEPSHKAAVNVTVEKVSPGKATLVIAPDAKWLLDPTRVFPVTVDPTYANTPVMATFDTFVQSGFTSDLSSTVDLRVGKNGTVTERSFLNFPTAPFIGKDIVSAHLSLMQYGSVTCTPTVVNVHSANPATTSTRWTAQPTTSIQVWGSVSAAKGFSSACAADRIYIPMTGLARFWSDVTYPTAGVALKAANEADANSWKRFYSTEGPADPYISLTWNRPPATPAKVNPSEAIAYRPIGEVFFGTIYSPNLRPWVKTKATDPDGNTVKYVYEFHDSATVGPNTLKATCTSSVYASGTEAGCRPSSDLPENTQIYIRAKTNDGRVDSPWTDWTALRIGSQPAAPPTIDCPPPYQDGTWQDSEPATDVTCTISATGTGYSAPGYIRVTVDGQPYPNYDEGGEAGRIKIRQSTDPAIAKTTVTIPQSVAGLHVISAVAETPAGRLSSARTHSFGWGGSGMTSPVANPRTTTTSTVRIAASGPPKGQSSSVAAHVRWRVSGYGNADDTVGWNEHATALTVNDKGAGGVSVSTLWDANSAKVDAFLDSDPNTAGMQPTTLNDRVPVLLDVQVCFTYTSSTQCTWSQTPNTTIQRLPHAFGNGFPTAAAGPGQVALWTGEFNTDATDVSVPGYTGDLSISRSHSTYAGPTNNIDGAFGQGWVAQFDGAEAGAAGMQVVDSTKVDGTIALVDGDGTSLIFESPSGLRRAGAAFELGAWVPADEDTELDGSKLTVSGTGASTMLSYTEDDGAVTTWKAAAAPTTSAPTLFRPETIAEPGIAAKTTFAYDGDGRVVRILSPAPPGVTCAAYDPTKPPLTGMNAGCRALRFVYTTIGATRVRLSEAWLDIYNPDKAGGAAMDSIKVAAYTYDVNALLTKVTDPRSNLSTEYTYNSANHLTSVKPAGQVPYQLNYVTVDQREKLDTVKRDRPAGDPAGGMATLARFVYDVPLSGAGLPDLSTTSVARWNQKAAPAFGFGVFGPDHPVAGTPTADDWQYADLQYTDAAGYTVNAAKYGAGDWQYTSTDYNEQGNVVRELDERALRSVIDESLPAGAAVDQLASVSVYNADVKNAAGTVVTPAGTLVTDTYGPSRFATLKDGSVRWVRTHTHFDFDEFAPNAGINPDTTLPYRLPTTETTSAFDPGAGTDQVISRTLTDYDPPVSGDPSGWALGLAGRVITDANPAGPRNETTGDSVKISRYDAEGRVIDTRQPNSSGADAGTTKTVYYTTAANSVIPECGAKPQWAGLICRTYPAAVPASSTGATPPLPTTTTSNFTYLLAPKTVVETSASVTRTLATTYLLDGRPQTTKTTVLGVSSSNPNTEKTTTYDSTTGQATAVTAKAADNTTTTVTTGFDTWGRATTYQPFGEQPTTTVYDAAGSVATVTDSNGSTRYTYDGTDAAGKAEHRGLPTKVEVTTAGSTWSSTGAYDAGGAMTVQKLPGGITQHNDLDNVGEPTGLRYTGQITTLNEDGSTTVDPDGPWLSWSLENDVSGQVTHEWTPDGTAFTGSTGDTPGDAIGYNRSYAYDSIGRLTQVQDRTAATTGVDVTDPTQAPGCVTRTYGFDGNDNRLTKSTAPAAADGACSTSGATTISRAFDTADRPVTGANGVGTYTYDALGRTTTLPASDAPKPADGDITLGYYDNDLARSITQGGSTTTFTLDTLDRRSVETVTDSSGSSQKVRHYADTTDNPTWVTEGTNTTRYAELIGDDLSLTVDQAGKGRLTLANTHGDVVSTIELPADGRPATTMGGWNSFDEYGSAQTIADTGVITYGWLGAKQRATSGADLILMGARLYNSASGLFSSTDPVDDGGANAYAYPTDPINQVDLDGKRWCWKLCRAGNEYVRWHWRNDRWGLDFLALLPLGKSIKAVRIARKAQKSKSLWKAIGGGCKGKLNCASAVTGNILGIQDAWNGRKDWWGGQKRFFGYLRPKFRRFGYKIWRRSRPYRSTVYSRAKRAANSYCRITTYRACWWR